MNRSDNILSSGEIIKLAEKPSSLIPLWEFIMALIFALTFSLLFYFGKFTTFENATIDFRFKQRGELPRNQYIVLVNITDDCINELGNWPWKREQHGKLLSVLKNAGAKTVAFDIMFTEDSLIGCEDDLEFAKQIQSFKNVVLPLVITKKYVLDPETFEMIEKIVPDRPCKALQTAMPFEGFIDLEYKTLNPDGVIRKLLLYKPAGDFGSYIFGIAAASAYLNITPSIEKYGMMVGDRLLPFHESYEPEAGETLKSYMINYAGSTHHFDEISYADALNGRFPDRYFENRLVLVGTRAKGISEDVKFSPFGAISGVEIHANLLHNILSRRFLTRNSTTTTILVIFIFALTIAYALWKSRRFFFDILTLLSAILWSVAALLMFYFDIVIEITPILFMVPIQWALTRLIQQFQTLREKNYDLARKVRELAIINEVTQAVSFMGDLGKTLDAIVSRGVQVLNAQRGSIFLLDEKYEELVEKSVIYGVNGEIKIDSNLRNQFKSGKGIAGEVFNSGKPRLIQNIRKDKSFEFRDSERDNYKSMICVPLVINDIPIGVMNVVNRIEGRFNNEDLQTALTMANQAAVVIEKARLYNLATIDGLTGLVVRRHFQAKIEEEFRRARRYGKSLSYLMTDIDHFKKFNDTYGHQTGDMVLREVAKIVIKSVRDTDIAARYGGEEFAVILPETEPDGAMLFAERLRQSVQDAVFSGPTGDLKVTISVGVSSFPLNSPNTATEMIKMADDALYVCKKNGRNRVEIAVNDDKTKSLNT
ncbi:MAG: diguanylate cyclase [Candidatus Riflebacteria bacterium]|nr:diguanylate cyclase [Candidatus Riflebacteria bacterium]